MSRMTAFSMFCCGVCAFVNTAAAADRNQAEALFEQDNYAEAYPLYQALAVQADTPPRLAAQDLLRAADCLERLNRVEEWDDLREQAAAGHPDDWAVAVAIAQANRGLPSWGYVTAGQFSRGDQRGGNWQNHRSCRQRDRTRLLQLMTDALPAFLRDRDTMTEEEEKNYLHTFRDLLLPDENDSWRLQMLTDLTTLPELGDNDAPQGNGAPVNNDGSPVFHALPESFATARSDGERWRWLLHLAEQSKVDSLRWRARMDFADFLRSQFGVQTLQRDFFHADSGDDSLAAVLAVETLSDDETIARLAGGIRRFQLPDEFNYIKIYQRLIDEYPLTFTSPNRLAAIYENRRQYPKAVEWWRKEAERAGWDATDQNNHAFRQIQRITGNWGEFLPGKPQVAGQPATATLRFRNAAKARLTVHRIDLEAMLAASKKHLRANGDGRHLDWSMTQPANMFSLLVDKKGEAFVKEQLAAWEETLQPLPGHRDRQVTIATPITKPGAYLVTATLPDGNISRLPLIVEDVKIVSKSLADGHLWQVLDAASGAPVPGLDLRLFGWNVRWNPKTKRNQLTFRELKAKTDAEGLAVLDAKTLKTNDDYGSLQWLVETTSPSGAYACHGYDASAGFGRQRSTWQNTKAFGVTDRPVYRPGQKVDFKFWIAEVAYDRDTPNPLAGTAVTVRLQDPKGDKMLETSLVADGCGGVAGDWQIPDNAALGMYSLLLEAGAGRRFYHRVGFRVEEYKKPEFEVSVDLPAEPPLLGDQVQVTVRAKYYFGAPVSSGQASIKVLRHDHRDSWWPVRPWDWFYGNGYAWLAEDAVWHPGWKVWGRARPYFSWLPPRHSGPPEVVVQIDRPLGDDGAVTFTLDTSLAKTLFGDRDHRYEITAEVRDQSRRTIVGTGSVIAPRKPFAVYVWTDRGYYHAGDQINASLQARTPGGVPVQGAGTLKLFRLARDPLGELVEKLEQEWPLASGDDGAAHMTINAAEPGQFRLTWTVTDPKGRAVEGAAVITIRQTGKQVEKDFHYNGLELIPDRPEYAPGDTVRLAVNTAQADSTVMVFVRPVNGACKPPVVHRLQGQSTIIELPVTRADMPNFFVEAYTIANGEMHHVIREIIVPPEKKVLQVEVLPDQVRHRPGGRAEVKVKLTDATGQPFAGNLAVAVYDASLDYIAGGDNTGDIRAAFWKWRRHHQLNGSAMAWMLANLLRENEKPMPGIGIFGDLDEADGAVLGAAAGGDARGVRFKAAGFGGIAEMEGLAMATAPTLRAISNLAMESGAADMAGGAADDDAAPAAIRSQFADTALWIASLDTQPDGTATVTVPMPENLTAWKMRVWAVDGHTRVGMGATELVTSKDLILRLQAPRFFVEKDEVVLSANVHNYLPAAQTVEVKLELDGPCLQMMSPPAQTVVIAAGAEARADWRVKAVREGEAVVRMFALAQAESDAMEQRFPVKVHGIDKTVAATGFLRPEQSSAQVKLVIPAERRPETTRLTVRWSPSLALAMLDAIPYLLDYPYGCTEQTLNRFLPAVLTRDTLRRLGLNLTDLQKQRANLNAQELGDPDTRRRQWQRTGHDPVFSEDEMDKMTAAGVRDLCAMQCADGGWGWFSGWGEHSWAHTTAQVVHGFRLAQTAGVDIPEAALQRGVAWLQDYQAEELRRLRLPKNHRDYKVHADNVDALVFRVLAETPKPGKNQPAMADLLFRDKTHLSPYGLALFGLGLSADPAERRTADVLRNLKQFLVTDDENQTAWLNLGNAGFWWFWYGDEMETHAAFLRLLVAQEPDGDLAPRLVKYLLNNRKHATYWRSTRDTAACLEAFAAFIAKTGEQAPDLTVDISLDGKPLATSRLTRDNLFAANLTLDLAGDDLTTGEHTLLLRKSGTGPLYFNTYLSYFTTEDMITKTGLEVKIDRQVYQLVREDGVAQAPSALGQVVTQRVEKYRRVPVASDAPLHSGDLLEIELTVESKNDYEYILLEDFKPAGCEPVDLRSGYNGNAFGAYVEFRDDRAAFLLRTLPRGRRSATYRVRAEIPGRFSALPSILTGMYAPELRANADEIKIVILDE